MGDLEIMYDENIDAGSWLNDKETKANFNEKNGNCKMPNFYILLAFLLITIALLTAVSIYCYLIKYQAK